MFKIILALCTFTFFAAKAEYTSDCSSQSNPLECIDYLYYESQEFIRHLPKETQAIDCGQLRLLQAEQAALSTAWGNVISSEYADAYINVFGISVGSVSEEGNDVIAELNKNIRRLSGKISCNF